MDETTREYLDAINKIAEATPKMLPLSDEVVWLEIFKCCIISPVYSSNPENTLTKLADEGLAKFKKRFRE